MAKRKEKFKVGDRVRFEGTIVELEYLGTKAMLVRGDVHTTVFWPSELKKIRK